MTATNIKGVYSNGLTTYDIIKVLIKDDLQITSFSQVKEFLEKEFINIDFKRNIIYKIITYLLTRGYYIKESKYTYKRTSITPEYILEQVQKDFSNKEHHKIIIENDFMINKMLKILEKYHPLPVSYMLFCQEIPEIEAKSKTVYLRRITLLENAKLVKRTFGSGNRFAYVLFNNDTVPTKIIRKDFYPLYLKTLNDLNIFKAALISISKKLQQGEDIRQVLIDTGNLIEEM